MKKAFVTGTGTGVGKTIVSAALCLHWKASYFKPIQTGLDSDTETVQRLTGAPAVPPRHHFPEPVSPHAAAKLAGAEIQLSDLQLPETNPLVVEGAGGVMVPINGQHLMLDVMAHFGLPVVVVASTQLGTINHTLLTLQALRHRNLQILGVVQVGEAEPTGTQAIEHYGSVPILFRLPLFSELTPASLTAFVETLHGF
ncbi:dethiobiotin synthase [Deinococcus roseus]|uniref:ATP-dependent dethiobiotin synthetase BioD n=1 Tax=Deinococcus roseus TaxID=392414 RepID=A0ABQ2D2I3_9DEIO|nr:dethiobiotin synthase [Deinococcus roseus]GGJ33044.1 hypothetical protein GCM10008938_19110 [Deinococcus roseus]